MSRVPIAATVGILGFMLYVGLAVALADAVPRHWALQALYFLTAGLAWVWPALRLILWAARK